MKARIENTRAKRQWLGWALLVVVMLVFAPTVTHPFVPLDDQLTIWGNERLNPPTDEGVAWFWGHPYLGLYMPLPYTVWGLLAKATWVPTPDEQGVHVDPRVFHAASVLAHALSALGVWLLLRRLLKNQRAAAIGALLFAFHPLQVEAVAWTSGLKDLMYAAFSIAALNFYVKSVQEKARGSYWIGLSCLVAGMLCKPTAMVTPALALVIDRLILGRPWRIVLRNAWPWFVAVLPLAVVAKFVQPPSMMVRDLSIVERVVVAGSSLAFYMGKLVWPVRLTIDYGWRPEWMLAHRWFWWFALTPAPIALGLWMLRRRWPWLAAGALVSVIALLPMLGLVAFMFQFYSTVADHYMYLAMLGPAMVAAWAASRSAPARWAIGAVIIVLAVLTLIEQHNWRSDESLLSRTLELNPRSLIGHNGLGFIHSQGSRRDEARAEAEFAAALAVDPIYEDPHVNLLRMAYQRRDAPRAIEQVKALIANQPRIPPSMRQDHTIPLRDMGVDSLMNKQFSEGAAYLDEYLKYHPDDRDAVELAKKAHEALAKGPATNPAK